MPEQRVGTRPEAESRRMPAVGLCRIRVAETAAEKHTFPRSLLVRLLRIRAS